MRRTVQVQCLGITPCSRISGLVSRPDTAHQLRNRECEQSYEPEHKATVALYDNLDQFHPDRHRPSEVEESIKRALHTRWLSLFKAGCQLQLPKPPPVLPQWRLELESCS